jgi:hypothetical protein
MPHPAESTRLVGPIWESTMTDTLIPQYSFYIETVSEFDVLESVYAASGRLPYILTDFPAITRL